MSQKNKKAPQAQDQTSAKKAAVLGGEPKKNFLPVILAVAAVIIAGAGLFMYGMNPSGGAAPVISMASGATQAVDRGDALVYRAADFADGRARYFSYQAPGGITIRYFILKSSDGVIRAAFDACDVCWPANKGYAQEGDYMICRNCGRRFPSVKVNEVKGGCNPAPLIRTMAGDKLIIKKADILSGSTYFNFG